MSYASYLQKVLAPKIKTIYGSQWELYGPYTNNNDGRRRVVLYNGTQRMTRQYAKIKLEAKLGRKLLGSEEVDHDDGDETNDKYYNLKILTPTANRQKDILRKKYLEVKCAWCDKVFNPRKDQVSARAKETAGPFCGKSCSGKYGSAVQNGKAKIGRKSLKCTQFRLNKNRV